MSHIQHVEKKCYVCIKNSHLKKIISVIIEKYPQIKQLMGHDPRIAIQVVVTVVFQIMMAVLVQYLPWKFVWLLTYIISGTLNHSLSISFHESMK
jgi:fatty acid desaturase